VRITPLVVGPLQANCWLVADERSGEAVLVDPGDEGERIARAVRDAGVTLTAIWLTHAHFDHVGGISSLFHAGFVVPIHLHPDDRPLYERAAESGAMFGVRVDAPPPPDQVLATGQELRVGRHAFTVVHTPGHAPGHVIFVGDGVALTGDLLFAGSIGRTDLPLADPAAMASSLERVAALPDETVVHPGHGPSTTIGRERATNPFLNGVARVVGA
jgi:glyoxylase-like metal-dependent hydrolase (beta-lactamase superfamily II)